MKGTSIESPRLHGLCLESSSLRVLRRAVGFQWQRCGSRLALKTLRPHSPTCVSKFARWKSANEQLPRILSWRRQTFRPVDPPPTERQQWAAPPISLSSCGPSHPRHRQNRDEELPFSPCPPRLVAAGEIFARSPPKAELQGTAHRSSRMGPRYLSGPEVGCSMPWRRGGRGA